MGKLIVDKFERLQNIRGTEFYKIIGIIKSYNYETGRIEIISLFDQTSCEIELDLESNANQEVIEIHNGLVVDAEVVNMYYQYSWLLKIRFIEAIRLPGTLLEFKDTLIRFSQLE